MNNKQYIANANQTVHRVRHCLCSIVPIKVFERFLEDDEFTEQQKQYFRNTIEIDNHWRQFKQRENQKTRQSYQHLSSITKAERNLLPPPDITIFDCRNDYILPGRQILKIQDSKDATVQRVYTETQAVIEFFQQIFARNSIDDRAMDLVSSVHYGVAYNNAFWNGIQMTYGDGDGRVFIDFTSANDVIAHELSHGFIQYSADFDYENQAGGLNESMADIFGSMFRQWRAQQNVNEADWLIGKEILGPMAIARGFRSLRNLSNPADSSCLSPQATHFSEYIDGMDPHESSGISNFAFYKAAMQTGGYSWEKIGQIWYQALTAFEPSPQMKMQTFANRTRQLAQKQFVSEPAIYQAVDLAWLAVGL